MFCTKCGTQLADDAQFCVKCGTPTGAAAQGNANTTPTSGDAGADPKLAEAKTHYKAGRYAEAAALFETLAELGNAEAQCELGYCYYFGRGVTQDDVKAVEWYRKSVEQGFAMAQYYLGDCYRIGSCGLEEDVVQALEWYHKAAEQENARACYGIGIAYDEGEGVTQDKDKAAEWYRKAAVLFQKDAEQGNILAQWFLGNMYKDGDGIPQDFAKAAEWYGKAADQDYGPARASLKKLSDEGKISCSTCGGSGQVADPTSSSSGSGQVANPTSSSSGSSAAMPAPSANVTKPAGDISVLIVDDSTLMRNIFGRIVEETQGLVVADKAMNGNFALQKIPRVNPDIILLDLEMPDMNGIEFLKERKKLGIEIPVVVLLPADHRDLALNEAISLGVSDFIAKPSGSGDAHLIKNKLVDMIFKYGGAYQRNK